jgi:hypothetical protein
MKRKQSLPPAIAPGTRIKIRLNYRTTIIVRTQQALQMWLEKYPGAQIVE